MKILKYFLLILIFLTAFFYRFSALKTTNFFWVDEFATVAQSKLALQYGLGVFTQPDLHFEHHNITAHFLVALFFKLFGESVFTAKLPFMIMGSLVPVLVFFLVKHLSSNKFTAVSASILTALSYWQITWSVQARSYMLQQVIAILLLIVYFQYEKTKNKLLIWIFAVLSVLAFLTHTTLLIVVGTIILSFLFFNFFQVKKLIKKPLFYILLAVILLIGVKTRTIEALVGNITGLMQKGLANNVWYYHSFLWREYSLVTFLGLLGLILLWLKKKQEGSVLLLIIFFFLIFVCFLFPPYVSRYLIVIFPFLLIGVALSLEKIAYLISKKNNFIVLILTLAIIINGDKFVVKPKTYYSVNHDMREIAIVDYNQVFNLIKAKGELEKNETAVIDPWAPRMQWYLGKDFKNIYWFRWIKEEGLVNGMGKETDFLVNIEGEKYLPNSGNPPQRFIGELADLQLAMTKYPKGFIWIDDTSLPADVINYAKENFKEELYLESYPPELLENPYSIWPGTLYSWGFD